MGGYKFDYIWLRPRKSGRWLARWSGLFRVFEVGLPAAVGVGGLLGLCALLFLGPSFEVVARVPGLDGRPQQAQKGLSETIRPGEPILGPGVPMEVVDAWPAFRGADRTNVAPVPSGDVPLARKWPSGGPPILWHVELGPGHAGPASAAGRVLVLDYDVAAQADTIRCFSLENGAEIWRNSYPVEVPENHGNSRTVPAIQGNRVVTLGPKCHLACWDLMTGQCRWFIDLVARYGTRVPPWYTGQCPVIDGDRVIVAPAGDVFMVALDLETGNEVWKTPRFADWDMTHSSIVKIVVAGKSVYVYAASGGVAFVDSEHGKLLCQTSAWLGKMATCPTPVDVGAGRLFLCGGYGAGSILMELVASDGNWVAKPVWRLTGRQYGSEHQTPVFFNGFIYGSRSKPGAEQFVCMDLHGQIRWESGADKFARGPYLIADGLIYALDENGTLYLIEAQPDSYRVLDRFTIWSDAHDAWGPMALVGGRLLVRDFSRLVCLDVTAGEN